MRESLRAPLTGLLAAAGGLAVAELLAAAISPAAAPVTAVGGAVIDATPTPVKEFAIRNLGTYDKPALLGGIALLLALYAAGVGLAARRSLWLGVAGVALFGAVGAAAALSRPGVGAAGVLPSALGALVAAGALVLLVRAPAEAPAPPQPGVRPRLLDRRTFAGTALLVAAGAATAAGGAVAVRQATGGIAARKRADLTLPAPAETAPPLPAGLDSGFITSSADFYRVDTALLVPQVDVDTWRLRITGMVDRPLELTFADLLKRPLIERYVTLNCVSNEVGGPYIGTARWLGALLAPLLREAGVKDGADQLVARSVDGMTIGSPVSTVLDGRDAMLAVGMNGAPLPLPHGFPVRMITPGLYGYVGACKWVTELELARFDDFDAYWVRRGWAARGPVKTASRIDRPQASATVAAGAVRVAGVAWAQHRGISSVQVQVDNGPWRAATLLPAPSSDTWVQWRYDWPATPGSHTLRVRAADGAGELQPETPATPFPDGATGWHSVEVTVARS
jgi:DMSO/TMAO reductase YedYZ molybdopterin-dependent catalytic subunit